MNDDLDTPYEQLSPHEVHCARQRLALAQAALFPARIAMARWSSGAAPALCDDQNRLRSAWYARIARNHQAWLDRGGFAQHDDLQGLRQPTMWHPPRLAAPSPEASEQLNEHAHPSCPTNGNDDNCSAAA